MKKERTYKIRRWNSQDCKYDITIEMSDRQIKLIDFLQSASGAMLLMQNYYKLITEEEAKIIGKRWSDKFKECRNILKTEFNFEPELKYYGYNLKKALKWKNN